MNKNTDIPKQKTLEIIETTKQILFQKLLKIVP